MRTHHQKNNSIDHKKLILKTVTWRIIATLLTFLIVYVISHQWALATGLSVLDNIVKGIMYYGHEYTWDAISTKNRSF